MLILETRRPGGPGFAGGASLPFGTIGLLEKKFAEILEDSEFCLAFCRKLASSSNSTSL